MSDYDKGPKLTCVKPDETRENARKKADELRATALRFNSGKVDYTLIPAKALESEARVWMNGEKKYGRSNWKKLWGNDTIDVVMASIMRHVMAIQSGEHSDKESGEYHVAHIRCNAAMLIEYYERLKDGIA